MGVKVAKISCCVAWLFFSQNTMTRGVSLMGPGPAFKYFTGFGYQGSSAPVGSAVTAPRPSLVTTEPSSPMTTKDGIPSTPKSELNSSLRSRSAKSNASHGISAKYSLKLASSLSEEAKTTSKPFPFKSLVYHSANLGVKPRQGG